MTRELRERARRLFMEVAELPAGEREDALDRACAHDAELRAEVEALVRAEREAGGFMASPTADGGPPGSVHVAATVMAAPREHEGQMIGRYKLLQPIGEGGFGSVWMAEQREPVKRRVALKIIKLGMDTKQVIARFEAERQALAMMDHPNIAKVLDAGSTEVGRPYFVMEYIKGVPILEYCDKERMDTRARLELFSSVCHAIQHAHQKGIIHRDIKPSNVLVTMHDGVPVPKVIDFGIAKATSSELTQKTLFTEHRQMIGTPAYMSPEQAEMSGLDIDTRSDIYSLGVLLYELLTGTTPFATEELMSKGFAEMMRIIREVEPHKPSTRLSTLGETASRTAEQRQAADPRRLGTMIKGDLDWIVMKCLEKDRTRRYESASGLAADIKRHLGDEPVSAGPPSTGYRVRKFVKRNKGQVIAAGLLAAALMLGVVGTTLGMVWAIREKTQADEARVLATRAAEAEKQASEKAQKRLSQIEKANGLLTSVFRDLDPKAIAESGRPLQAVLAQHLDKAASELEGDSIGDPLVVAGMQMDLGMSLGALGEARKGATLLEKALATYTATRGPEDNETLIAMNELAMLYFDAGETARAEKLMEDTLSQRRARGGAVDIETITCMNNLALIYGKTGKRDRAIALLTDALELRKLVSGPEDPETANAMHNLALAYQGDGHVRKALPLVKEALRIRSAAIGDDHPHTLLSTKLLADCYMNQERLDLAVPLLVRAYARAKSTLGPDHPMTLSIATSLSKAYYQSGQVNELTTLLEATLPAMRAKLGADDEDTLNAMGNLAGVYWMRRELDKSIPLFEETVKGRERVSGRDHPETLRAIANLGVNYASAHRTAEALPLLEEAYRTVKKNDDLKFAASSLLDCYAASGQTQKAVEVLPDVLSYVRDAVPAGSTRLAGALASIGSALLQAKAYPQAEELLRECLALREKLQPDEWNTFNTRSLLGGVMLGQNNTAAAEPLLLDGYEGMKAREASIPAAAADRLTDAIDRLVALYTALGRADDVKKWQAERARAAAPAAPGEER